MIIFVFGDIKLLFCQFCQCVRFWTQVVYQHVPGGGCGYNQHMYPASARLHKIKFSADEHGLNRGLIFELRSVKRFFNTLTEAWSLNGIIMITLMLGVVVSVDRLCCWSDTLESMNCLTARLNNFLEYISFQNMFSSQLNSCEKYNRSDGMP